MRYLLGVLGHKAADFDCLRIVHIAGSKGKGSTAAFAESILRHHGLKTALFTSPHLVHPRERLRINGRSMDLEAFSHSVVDIYLRLKSGLHSKELPGLFRFLTLLAFDHMWKLHQEGQLDVAIVEVGMGGRYDATNVVEKPIVTAITSLAMEHVKSLGPTLADIASHKVGIAKSNVPLLSAPQPAEVVNVLLKYSEQMNCALTFVEPSKLDNAGLAGITLCT